MSVACREVGGRKIRPHKPSGGTDRIYVREVIRRTSKPPSNPTTRRFQTSGDTNPDGWGVGWYVDGSDTPEQYRTVTPIWDDDAFAATSRLVSNAVVAAARLRHPARRSTTSGTRRSAPGAWLFSLNGIVHGFTEGVGDELRAR